MRKLLGKVLTLSALTGALLLVSTPARADFLDFTVDEGAVPGAVDLEHTVDKINGAYAEIITFDVVTGTFATSAYANFTQYLINEGADPVVTQLFNLGDNGYGLYAEFYGTGTFDPVAGTLTGATASVIVYLDPNLDTTFLLPGTGGGAVTFGNTGDDIAILATSDLINALGIVAPDIGAFEFNFLVAPTDLTATGQLYWPTLAGLTLISTIDGDFDEFEFVGTQNVTGDLSVVFQEVAPIPEPATLTLLGLGLLGGGYARRRRQSKA